MSVITLNVRFTDHLMHFWHNWRIASEDVILFLVKTKCIPVLLYGIEALPTNKSIIQSLQFSFSRIIFKILKTRSIDVVSSSLEFFGIDFCNIIENRKRKFLQKIVLSCNNTLFIPFANLLKRELAEIM